MYESFLFSINAILPIFLLAPIGAYLRYRGILPLSFFQLANKFVFQVTLPITLFYDVVTNGAVNFGSPLTLFCACALGVELLLLLLIIPLFVKDNAKRGAMIQGAFRSNVAIIGIPLIASLFGDAGSAAMTAVVAVMVTLFNISAVIVLSIFAPAEKKLKPRELLLNIIKKIVKNPLIIAIIIGMLFRLLPFRLPIFVDKTLVYLDGLTIPLALMSIGATFEVSQLRGRLGLAALTTLLRCVIIPTAAIIAAIAFGFRGPDLCVVMLIFGASSAVASYIMAQNMGADSLLAGQIVMLTTLTSAFTLFAGTYILRLFGFF